MIRISSRRRLELTHILCILAALAPYPIFGLLSGPLMLLSALGAALLATIVFTLHPHPETPHATHPQRQPAHDPVDRPSPRP